MHYAINKHTKEHRVIRDSAQAMAFGIIDDWRIVEADSEGWIKHDDGECPLPANDRCDIKLRHGGSVRHKAGHIGHIDWAHTSCVAYRPIFEDKEKDMEEEYWFEMDEDWRGPQCGLPPIGIEVEVRRCDSDWRKATVVGHDGCRVIVRMNTDAIVYDWAVGGGIRPILDDKEQDMTTTAVDDQFVPDAAAWNGEGLPPVGAEVEFASLCDAGEDDENTIWEFARVIGYDGPFAVVAIEGGGYAGSSHKADFRPIRTAAQRAEDEAVEAMSDAVDTGYAPPCRAIYTAIREGRIPGVKLED